MFIRVQTANFASVPSALFLPQEQVSSYMRQLLSNIFSFAFVYYNVSILSLV